MAETWEKWLVGAARLRAERAATISRAFADNFIEHDMVAELGADEFDELGCTEAEVDAIRAAFAREGADDSGEGDLKTNRKLDKRRTASRSQDSNSPPRRAQSEQANSNHNRRSGDHFVPLEMDVEASSAGANDEVVVETRRRSATTVARRTPLGHKKHSSVGSYGKTSSSDAEIAAEAAARTLGSGIESPQRVLDYRRRVSMSSASSAPDDVASDCESKPTSLNLRTSSDSTESTSSHQSRSGSSASHAVLTLDEARSSKQALGADLAKVSNTKFLADCALLAPDETGKLLEVPAHKIIMAARCVLLNREFRRNKAVKIFHTQHATHRATVRFVDFVYSDDESLVDRELAEELLHLALQFGCSKLAFLCLKHIDEETFETVRSETVRARKAIESSHRNDVPGLVAKDTAERCRLEQKREFIVKEIVSTEKKYVESLKRVMDVLVLPLRENLQSSKTPFIEHDVMNNFNYWDVLFKVHQRLLSNMEQALTQWTAPEVEEGRQICGVFSMGLDLRKVYEAYIAKFQVVWTGLRKEQLRNKAFDKFLTDALGTEAVGEQTLQSLLIVPVQRIPRLVLLLTDLDKATHQNHPDRLATTDALERMRNLAEYLNTRKADSENLERLIELQSHLQGFPASDSLPKQGRSLLREGTLRFEKSNHLVWLMTDALLIAKPIKREKHKFRALIDLCTSQVKLSVDHGQPKAEFDFELICPAGTFRFGIPENAGVHPHSSLFDVDESVTRRVKTTPANWEVWFGELSKLIETSQGNLVTSALMGAEYETDSRLARERGSEEGSRFFTETQLSKRSECALRILNQQREYYDALKSLDILFYTPLHTTMDTIDEILPATSVRTIFSNIRQIARAHQMFLRHKLTPLIDTWNTDTRLGDTLFKHLLDIFQAYEKFLQNRAEAAECLESAFLSSDSFTDFVAKTEDDNNVELRALLDTPRKLLPTYQLLFSEILRLTPVAHKDYKQLNMALAKLKEQISLLARSQASDGSDQAGGSPRKAHTMRARGLSVAARTSSGIGLSMMRHGSSAAEHKSKRALSKKN